jgi:Protein of unknown function (DUF1449)
MAEVLVLALSFPSVVFTVLLGVVLIYWSFVMVGVIHIGEGSEGALDGHLGDIGGGHADVGDFGGGHADVGDIGGGGDGHADFGDGGGDGHGGDGGDGAEGDEGGSGSHSALAVVMSALHLRSVPATVVFSLIITFSWLVSVVTMQVVTRSAPGLRGPIVSLGVLLASFVLALPLTSIAARPLAKVFAPKHAPVKSDFIGRTCVVRTGSVTDKFGEATLHDGGAGLVLRVRIEDGKQLGRGEQALIVDYDAERETYLVEPMRDVMNERK